MNTKTKEVLQRIADNPNADQESRNMARKALDEAAQKSESPSLVVGPVDRPTRADKSPSLQ